MPEEVDHLKAEKQLLLEVILTLIEGDYPDRFLDEDDWEGFFKKHGWEGDPII